MEEQTYKAWWPLHLRVAKGEELNPEERARYEAGLKQMYGEEKLDGSKAALRVARQRVVELRAEYARLRSEYEALEAETAAREAQLSEPTWQLLGIGN